MNYKYQEITESLPGCVVLPVTKYVGIEEMVGLLAAGAEFLGESRVQDAERKFLELETMGYGRESFERHLIGHLQTNKAKKAVEIFDVIQSVDSLKIAKEISRSAVKIGKEMDVFLQVNAADDEAKFGFSLEEARSVVEGIGSLPSLNLVGLMMIGRFGVSEEETRQDFEKMKRLFDEFVADRVFAVDEPVLSMGMSGDYQLAIECGATMVRLGSILFK